MEFWCRKTATSLSTNSVSVKIILTNSVKIARLWEQECLCGPCLFAPNSWCTDCTDVSCSLQATYAPAGIVPHRELVFFGLFSSGLPPLSFVYIHAFNVVIKPQDKHDFFYNLCALIFASFCAAPGKLVIVCALHLGLYLCLLLHLEGNPVWIIHSTSSRAFREYFLCRKQFHWKLGTTN